MSKSLSAASIAEFDAQVKQAYQGQGKLGNTVRVRSGVVGGTHRFPKLGKGIATRRVPQTDVVPMNVQHSNQTATLEDWNAAEYTDIFDQAEVNFDEKRELSQAISGAIGRRKDQLIIDALDAASTTLTVATTVGGAGTGWNVAKAREASRLLNDQGVPMSDRTCAVTATGLSDMLGTTEATSSDYNTVKALVQGELDTFVGFKWIIIETRDEGGLPKPSTQTSYAWHKDAVGLAVGIEQRTEINYIPEKTSWLCNGIFKAGAIDIDALGIVEISTTE